jgi:hypothetical protein
MMNRDTWRQIAVDRATRRYAGSVRQGSVPCRADGNSAGQTDNYRDAAERSELRYEQVKKVLCELGVSTIQFVTYRGFSLHVDKLFRDYDGETLRARVADAVLRWRCYGCSPEILRAITKTVFALDLPSPSESCKP